MRIGVVGAGRWGKLIVRDLAALGCTVVVMARSDASRARALESGADEIVSSIEALGAVDGVVVATPTNTHADVLDTILESYPVPVFVEKPLTNDVGALPWLLERGGNRLFVMDKWRYHPAILAMGEMVRAGEFGAVRSMHSRRLSWGQSHDDVDAVWILAPHDLSIVLEVLGYLPPARAAAGGAGPNSDGWLVGLLGDDPTVSMHISSLSPVRERRVEVEFDRAVVMLDDAYADRLRIVHRGTGDEEGRPVSDEMPLLTELAAFVEHLRGGPPPKSNAVEAALIVERLAELRSMAGI
jgi:predicted dehydrogenase